MYHSGRSYLLFGLSDFCFHFLMQQSTNSAAAAADVSLAVIAISHD